MSETDSIKCQNLFLGTAKPSANVWKPGGLAESSLIRTEATTGILKVGFWRTHATAYRCRPDGSCLAAGNAPLHDAVLVIEGSGTVTIPSTDRKIQIEPGLIVSHPQGIETHWDIDAPYLKKFFVEWDRSDEGKDIGDVHVGNVSDNPGTWKRCEWSEPSKGVQRHGESYLIRQEDAPDVALVGVWRSESGAASVGASGPKSVFYSAQRGDTTAFLIEGRVRVENHATREIHELRSGDVISMSKGLPVTWTDLTPFTKTFFVLTTKK